MFRDYQSVSLQARLIFAIAIAVSFVLAPPIKPDTWQNIMSFKFEIFHKSSTFSPLHAGFRPFQLIKDCPFQLMHLILYSSHCESWKMQYFIKPGFSSFSSISSICFQNQVYLESRIISPDSSISYLLSQASCTIAFEMKIFANEFLSSSKNSSQQMSIALQNLVSQRLSVFGLSSHQG